MPVFSIRPPLDAEYQLIVPALALAPKVTVPVPHLELGVVEEIVGAAALIVALTAVLLAVVHPLDVAST